MTFVVGLMSLPTVYTTLPRIENRQAKAGTPSSGQIKDTDGFIYLATRPAFRGYGSVFLGEPPS